MNSRLIFSNPITPDEMTLLSNLLLGMIGLFFVGPLSHGWYLMLEKLGHRQIRSFPLAVSPRLPFASHIPAVKKMLIDQTLGATTFTALFFTMTGFLKGQNISEVQQKLRQEYWNTLVLNWTIWPAAMLINFGLIPLDKRVLFANCVGLGWGTYLSIVSNRKVKSVEKSPPNPCLKT